jgi:uncharacterized protein YbaR (Trm112 family)
MSKINNDYGLCDVCQTPLQADWFIDKEFYPKSNAPTGRTRLAVNFLYCPRCGKKYPVDDTFDGNWHN